MKKRFTLFKTLLVAAALLVGGSAWADITYNYELVNQNFSDVTSESANWTTGNGMALAQTLRSGTDYYYTMSFGNSGNAASTADYNITDLSSFDAYKLQFSFGMYSCSATNRNSLFKIVGSSADLATTGSVKGQSSSITITAGETSTELEINKYGTGTRGNANRTNILYRFTVEGINVGEDSEKGVWLTITSEDGLTEELARTKIADFQTVTKLHFEAGQYYGQNAIDNILLQAYSAVEVVPDPMAAITAVNGVDRTITITEGTGTPAGASLKYYTTVDDGDNPTDLTTYSAPFVVSTAGKIYYYAESTGGTKSNIMEIESGAGVTVALASPSVGMTSVTVNTNYLTSPTFAMYEPNNSNVLLTPATETLSYTFTPEGGAESARTVISSGESFTPTEKGVLKVYASTTGYDESVYEIPVSNYYVLASTVDMTTGIDVSGWSTVDTWEGYTAYRVAASGNWKRLNIQNANTIDYIEGFGFSRRGNTYTYRIRNSVKGQIFNVTQTSVAAEPALTYQQVLCVSGKGGESDVTSFPTAVPANLAVKQIDFFTPASENVIATVGSNKWATFVAPYALDFSSVSGLSAYTATTDGSTVELAVATEVPAGTPLILKAVAANDYTIPVIGSASAVTNHLQSGAVVDVAADTDYKYYGLTVAGDKAKFALIGSGAIAEGKAYLKVAASTDARTILEIAGQTTGIETIAAKTVNGEMFNLQGVRVAQPTKGLYIVNGKKVIK